MSVDLEREKKLRQIDYLVQQRERHASIDFEHWKSHDQAILTLASGAIGLSIAFLDEIAPEPRLEFLLYISWSTFLLAIISVLVSFRLASAGTQWEILRTEEHMQRIAKPSDQQHSKEAENPHLQKLRWVNNISGTAFVLGLVFLLAFAIVNFESRVNINMKKDEIQNTSYDPPLKKAASPVKVILRPEPESPVQTPQTPQAPVNSQPAPPARPAEKKD